MLFRTVLALLAASATAFTASKPTMIRPVSDAALDFVRRNHFVVVSSEDLFISRLELPSLIFSEFFRWSCLPLLLVTLS
jgi:hypothetical protein